MSKRTSRSIRLAERLWEKANVRGADECWPWMASTQKNGYGRIGIDCNRVAFAHRIAYELTVGPIPEGMQIDHLCRNRACVNPEHLELVSATGNMRRGFAVTRPPRPDLADRMRRARAISGLTQNDLAKRLGCSKQAVSAWEMGRSLPRQELGQRLDALLEQCVQLERL